MPDVIGFCSKSPIIYIKKLFSETAQSDFLQCSTNKYKRHHQRCLYKNGAASKKVRAFHTAHPLGRLILRRHLAPIKSGAAIPDLLCPRKSNNLYNNTIKKTSVKEAFLMVPLVRIGLTTPSLPMTCSTTEL